jgi:ABC-type antimicrobial peptide transport system permease subunit
MGVIRNIKASIDDKSSMSVNSITLLVSALMGVIIGLVICFVLIYDVTYDGKVDTNLTDMGIFLLCSGGYIMGSGVPKAWVDSKMKMRSWVEGEKMQAEADEDIEDMRMARRRRRGKNLDDNNENEEDI